MGNIPVNKLVSRNCQWEIPLYRRLISRSILLVEYAESGRAGIHSIGPGCYDTKLKIIRRIVPVIPFVAFEEDTVEGEPVEMRLAFGVPLRQLNR